MAESAGRSFTTSASSAAKRPASKKSASAKAPATGGRATRSRVGGLSSFFSELARLAEMTEIERRLRALGFRAIGGTDEVGRGCLAGPVVAAAVVLEGDPLLGVRDSKALSPGERQILCRSILRHCRAVGIGVVDAATIDRINILQASKLAMKCAVEMMDERPDVLLIDAIGLESLDMPQLPLIEGDRRSVAIAAASIVAKVYRDTLMQSYHDAYPQYDFAIHKGYATEVHQAALRRYGPCPIHRRSFEGVGEAQSLFDW